MLCFDFGSFAANATCLFFSSECLTVADFSAFAAFDTFFSETWSRFAEDFAGAMFLLTRSL